MDFLIIPLIALAVWILQYVFKGPEDNKQQQQAKGRNAPPPRPNAARPRRQVNDLDRFLEETRKRKQQEERRPIVIAEAVPTAVPADRGEAVERERKAQAARSRPQPARPVPRPERRPQRVEQPRRPSGGPPVRETAAPVLLEAVLVEPIPSLPQPPPPRPATSAGETVRAPREAAQSAATVTKSVSPFLVNMVQMLRKPQGALLALVLREILDAPVSRRNGMK